MQAGNEGDDELFLSVAMQVAAHEVDLIFSPHDDRNTI
jgi:hypothetical protein